MSALTRMFSGTSSLLSGLLKHKKGAAPQEISSLKIPGWYRPHLLPETRRLIHGDKPVFLYIPWIAEHTDALIAKLGSDQGYTLVPFDIFQGVEDNTTRREIFRFAQENPDVYRRLVARRLVQLRRHICGIIFTFDWAPIAHMIANVCAELDIPRILIPHESVFVDRDKYYWDPTTRASVPIADLVLGWGRLQREIFLERGYPAERFQVVGAPKFDPYAAYQPALTREQFCRLYGLRADHKIILFATQPLDSQLDTRQARKSQASAISDLFEYAQAHGCQLLVRLPPSKDDVLGDELRTRLIRSPAGAVDDAHCYLVPPEEAVYHADVVSSVNSTMLFEAVLLGRPALSMKYVAFDQVWEKVGIPAAHNREEMAAILADMLAGRWAPTEEGMAWAADMFSIGAFDGKASSRIGMVLADIASGKRNLQLRADAGERLFAGQSIDVVGVPPIPALSQDRQPHLLSLLKARTRVDRNGAAELKWLSGVDVFLRWGMGESEEERAQFEIARALGRPLITAEDGLIGPPGASLILDDTTAHYDAAGGSRLERWLKSGPDLTVAERQRAQAAINRIVSGHLSRIGPATAACAAIGSSEHRKILVVDQAIDDPAVRCSAAGQAAFAQMLRNAMDRFKGCDIIIFRDFADGTGHLGADALTAAQIDPQLIGTQVFEAPAGTNPHAIFQAVDEVFVVTSHVGFEALMAGKTVQCHGTPFYAGWGLTEDHVPAAGRGRSRTIEDLFHASYILHSRYCDPRSGEAVELEQALDQVAAAAP
ncbi:capsular polysaccharide export protein, LipB/KpsS family [Xanthobacter variabilis]|uniref:capsular polysaccharide export protein, LipB/KpsS family n=1 Tax=Xanthobacter variabilis TaxID=3119932 RepID=UPI00374FD12C